MLGLGAPEFVCISFPNAIDLYVCAGTIDKIYWDFRDISCYRSNTKSVNMVCYMCRFVETLSVCAGLTCLHSRFGYCWKCMAHHEKENQTVAIDSWAAKVFIQRELTNVLFTKPQQLLFSVPTLLKSVIKGKGDVCCRHQIANWLLFTKYN